ncbi:hypothetical protein Tco_0621713 [Tanacetum coccineum]
MARALPSDRVKNPKLNVNTTTLVLSARSYLTEDPQCSTHIYGSTNTITIHPKQQSDSRDSMAKEKEREREGDPDDTNTIVYNKEQRDTSQLERKDITVVDNLGPNRDDKGIEWLDVEETLDLVDTSEESVYESLIMEMPKCSLNYDFKIKKGDPRNLKIPCMIGTERSKFSSEGHDFLSSRIILSKDDYDRGCRKPSDLEDGFYRDTIKLGSEYLTRMDDEGEFTLYLMRRNLEVLRKFHWMILGGRFNQFLALMHFGENARGLRAHLEKKRTRLRTYTKSLEDLNLATESYALYARIFKMIGRRYNGVCVIGVALSFSLFFLSHAITVRRFVAWDRIVYGVLSEPMELVSSCSVGIQLGATKIVLLGFESVPLTSRFVGNLGCIFNKGLFGIFHATLSIVGTTADLT